MTSLGWSGLGGFAAWYALWFVVRFTPLFAGPLGCEACFPLGGAVFCVLAVFDISMSVGGL